MYGNFDLLKVVFKPIAELYTSCLVIYPIIIKERSWLEEWELAPWGIERSTRVVILETIAFFVKYLQPLDKN